MKLGITLLARGEIDIIRQWLDFHLSKCDFMVITDNGSVDGTREILQAYRDRYKDKIVLIDEPEQNYQQAKWVDTMVRISKDNRCDWVLNADADEFYHADLRGLVERQKDDVGSIAIKCRLYVPTTEDNQSISCPIKRMKYWTKEGRNQKEKSCLTAWNKLIIRTKGFKNIELGNHKVEFEKPMKEIMAGSENYIAHYPFRCWKQFRSKIINGGEAYTRSSLSKEYGWHWRQRWDVFYKGGSVALKKLWFEELDSEVNKLERDK